jgi:hypothetical protein
VRTFHTVVGLLGILSIGLLAYTCGPGEEGRRVDPPLQPPSQDGDPPTGRRDMLDDLRVAQAAPRHSSDGGGRAWFELAEGEAAVARVGERRTWKIVYEAGPEGIAVGGLVRLTIPRFWGWSPAQSSAPDYPGFTLATTDAEGVELEPFVAPEFWVEWRIGGRPLAEGERVTIVYGDGPGGARVDRYAEEDSRLWISVDGDGDGWARVLPDSPAVTVLAGPPAELTLILPSTAEPGDEVPLRIAVLDALGSAGVEFEGEVELGITPDGLEGPPGVTLEAADGGVTRVDLTAVEPGVYRVLARATVGDRELLGLSNPLLVENRVAPIRWADLHGHSNLSDGTGTPEDFYTYARDVSGLDVVSLTDHDHWGMLFLDEEPELWEGIRETTDRFHDPGSFVTVLGYEWTNWVHGHRHVLYFDGLGEVLSSIDPDYETPAQLWDALRGKTALTFAHHSAGGPVATNWDYPPDPELEPVTEVVSVHGNSEAPDAPYRIYSPLSGNFVRDVLDRGYRLGFVGSADSHDGHPGFAHFASPTGSGIAALLTDDLTRPGVYSALKERRCYATNGDRIVLRAAIDAEPMGSSLPASEEDAEPLLYVRVIGTAPLAGVEVIRSGEVIETIDGEEVWDLATTVDLEPLRPGEYVYVRAIQTDRGTAWSSPFFVD